MRRRDFIALLASAMAGWPRSAPLAQQRKKLARIGYLAIRSPVPADEVFVSALRELGWIEGQNVVIERRFAAGSPERLKQAAAELVRLEVDVLVTVATAATQAAKDATASIPTCFVNLGDPVGQGFVESLARPGRNITGLSFDSTPQTTAKQLQLLLEAAPQASHAAVLWNPSAPYLRAYWNAAQLAAPGLRVNLQSVEVQDSNHYESAFEGMRKDRVDAVLVLPDSYATLHRARITELAAKFRMPAIYGHSLFVEAGGLMSYGPSFEDAYRRAAGHVNKMLEGVSPAELPVQEPVTFELIVNMKAAKQLDLALAPPLLARADRVIE